MSRISQNHVNACKALDRTQSVAAYIKLTTVQSNLEFFHEFLTMADRNAEIIEGFCLPGMAHLIQTQLDEIYRAILILCPAIDEIEAQEIQKEIDLKNMRYGASD